MRQAWRWYGPDDPVTLDHVRQAGAHEIVTALHQYAPGEVWPREAVAERRPGGPDAVRLREADTPTCPSVGRVKEADA